MPNEEKVDRGAIIEAEALDKMVTRARYIAEVLRTHIGGIRIVSHHDADGICSAAIIARALAREGKPFHLSFVKQLYGDVIQELADEGHQIIVFLDMGSGQIELIQEHILNDKTKVVVIDHHRMNGEITSDDMIHLNPVEFGIDENISGSGTSYIVARAMNPANRELSQLAIIGAIGDSQIGAIGSHWGLFGLNKEILKDAESTGKIRVSKGLRLWGRTTRPIHKALEYSMDPYIPGISGSESGAVHFLQELGIELRNKDGSWKSLSGLTKTEMKKLTTGIIKERIRENHDNPEWVFGDVYDLLDKDELKDANEFATILNAAGKQDMGYVGIALCLNNKEYHALVEKMLEKYRREIGKSLRWVEKNPSAIRTTENANYVLAGGSIPETIISNVVSIMHRSDMLPESEKDKPVFALVDKEGGDIKVSARASDRAVENGLSLQEVVSKCVSIIGGEGGGHAGAAGASIPKGSEESFINSIEEILMKLKTDTGNNIQKEVIEDGTAKSEGGSDRGSGKGPEGEGIEREEGAAKGVGSEAKKAAEGEGLVRYLGS